MKNKHFNVIILCISLCQSLSFASPIKNQYLISDSSLSVFRETQLGLNLFNTNNDHYYQYSTKLGVQMHYFQTGVCTEHEYNFTKAYNEPLIQRNRSYGVFFGLEVPLGNQFKIGLIQAASVYNKNFERPVYSDNNLGLFSSFTTVLYQTQLRTLYQLNKNFSVLASAQMNLIKNNLGNLDFNKGSNFSLSVGMRYALFADFDKNDHTAKPIRLFAGSQLERENTSFNSIIGVERSLSNQEILDLTNIGTSTSNTFTIPLLGIMDKRNNMLLFGFNQRQYRQYEDYFGLRNNTSIWKLDFNHISSRMAIELNIFNFFGKSFVQAHNQFYPFYRITGTYSIKNISVTDGWSSFNYVNDTTFYDAKINSKTSVKSFEIINSFGLAMKISKLYMSAGLNVFNHKYGMVQFDRSISKDYYTINNPVNIIKNEISTEPSMNSEGWLKTKPNNMNLFLSIGLVF